MLIKAKGIPPYHKFTLLLSYPAMTLGIALIFARWLIDTFWVRLVIGLGLFAVGLLLNLSMHWGWKHSN